MVWSRSRASATCPDCPFSPKKTPVLMPASVLSKYPAFAFTNGHAWTIGPWRHRAENQCGQLPAEASVFRPLLAPGKRRRPSKRPAVPSCLAGSSPESSNPFSGSRDEWVREEPRESSPERKPSSQNPPPADEESPFSSSRAQFSENESFSGAPKEPAPPPPPNFATRSGPVGGSGYKAAPPSPMTATRALRALVRFGARLVNQIILPAFYILSLAWHDFKLRATAPAVKDGENRFFLPEPVRQNVQGRNERGSWERSNWAEGSGQNVGGESDSMEELSTEEKQAKLVQDATLRVVDSVQKTAGSALGAINDFFGFGQDEGRPGRRW